MRHISLYRTFSRRICGTLTIRWDSFSFIEHSPSGFVVQLQSGETYSPLSNIFHPNLWYINNYVEAYTLYRTFSIRICGTLTIRWDIYSSIGHSPSEFVVHWKSGETYIPLSTIFHPNLWYINNHLRHTPSIKHSPSEFVVHKQSSETYIPLLNILHQNLWYINNQVRHLFLYWTFSVRMCGTLISKLVGHMSLYLLFNILLCATHTIRWDLYLSI